MRAKRTHKTTKNTTKKKVQPREKYVIDKAKMASDAYHMLHHSDYEFSIARMFNSQTFELFANLDRNYINEYKELLHYFLLQKGSLTDMEKLVWSSEFLDALNSHPDEFKGPLENLRAA